MSNLRRSIRPFGLRFRATLVVASLIICAVLGASVISALRTNQILKRNQELSVDGLGSGLASAVELALAVGDAQELNRLASEFSELIPDVEFILIKDSHGRTAAVVAANNKSVIAYENNELDPDQVLVRTRSILSKAEFTENQDYFDVIGVIEQESSSGSAEIGSIVIGVSQSGLHASQRAQWKAMLITMGAIMVVAMPMIFMIVGGWTKRLSRLARVTRYISEGDYSHTLSDHKDDEIGKVFDAYEHMRLAIRERNESEQRRQAELEEARQTADTANQAKSQFLAHMSHEIRTPINGVIGMLELLSMTETSEKQRKQIRTATSSADSLLCLINDILDFSKIESGQMDIESISFDLHDLFETVAEMLAHTAAKKGVELICCIDSSVPRFAIGDPTRLRQVVINLVNNAIKFTETGDVVIRLNSVSRENDGWVLRAAIEDSGIGIPEGVRDRLFKSFSQVDATTTRKFGGTGLGLAISKGFVELMGGEIGIKPDREIGSEFWFTFNAGVCDKVVEKRPIFRGLLRDMHTIIVDDNQTNLDIYTEALSNWGMRPVAFNNGRDALKALSEHSASDPFQLAILDMQMPDMDGVQLADAIVADESIDSPTMVMLTSMYHTPDANDLANLSLAACLQKPVRLSTLHDALAQYMYNGTTGPEINKLEESAEINLTGARALVAEDNSVNQLVISELLKSAGIVVDMVDNGAEVVSRVDADNYDFVLMDCEMPELDGFEATRWIRNQESAWGDGRHIPIIALTANAIHGDRERCIDAGMDDYLTKPINAKKLFATLQEWYTRKEEPNTIQGAVSVGSSNASSLNGLDPDSGEGQGVLDIEGALQRCAGKEDILCMVFDEFERVTQHIEGELLGCIETNDLKSIALQAHSLKGAAANIGASKLADDAKELENAAKTQDALAARESIDQIAIGLDQLRAALPSIKHSLRGAA